MKKLYIINSIKSIILIWITNYVTIYNRRDRMNKNKLQSILCMVLPIVFIGVLAVGFYNLKLEKENLKSLKADYEMSFNSATKPAQGEESENKDQSEDAKEDTATGKNQKFNFKDKTVLFLGDGVSVEGTYQKVAADTLGLKDYINGARSGLTIGEMEDEITSETIASTDIVIIFGGTNDYSKNGYLGKISDSPEADSFYGNVQSVIDNIKSLKSDIEIVFLTPLKHGYIEGQPSYPNANNNGNYLDDYVEAIKEVCDKNNVKYIDMFNESGIDENNVEEFTLNNIMLNEKGHNVVGKTIAEELETLFKAGL